MRKGLKSTLLTVAVALLGFKAMAMAPTISSIPDVIIGDAEAGTATNLFVFPNAFDSRTVVSDDTTSAGAIKWTYSTSAATGPGAGQVHYNINGHPSVTGAVVDQVNPPATYDLTQGVDDPASTDSDLRTFTFRNIKYSPINGSNTDPGSIGVTTDSATITLVASDTSTVSLGKSFRVFILNNGFDKLSGGAIGVPVKTYDFTGGSTLGWTTFAANTAGGTVNLTNSSAGLCADASAAGDNFSGWQSEPSYDGVHDYTSISFTDNAVYRLRTTVTTTAVGGHTPLWFVYFENTLSWYGGFFQFFDAGIAPVAGAETPGSSPTIFQEYLNAPAEGTAGFKAILSSGTFSHFKDFRLEVGVLDVASSTYDAGNDSGAICWQKIIVDKFDIGGLVVTSTPYNIVHGFTNIVAAEPAGTADPNHNDLTLTATPVASNLSYTGGDASITPPTTSSWPGSSGEFFTLLPGDSTGAFALDGVNGNADITDNYPIPWTAHQLYRIVYTLQAPSATAETNPPSYFWMGGYTPTIELISYVYTTNQLVNGGSPSAMPKLAAAQDYYTFFDGNYVSLAGGIFQSFRPIIFGASVPAFQNPPVQGGIKMTGSRVELVHF